MCGMWQDLLDALLAAQPPVLLLTRSAKIIEAKVPIIKCHLASGHSSALPQRQQVSAERNLSACRAAMGFTCMHLHRNQQRLSGCRSL